MSDPATFRMPAAELRRIFDQSFAVEAADTGGGRQRFVAIQAGGKTFAVCALDMTELVSRKQVVPVPSRMPELLGIAAVRGALVPVYDLASLLGLPPGRREQAWMIVVSRETAAALAFDDFEGQFEAAEADVFDNDRAGGKAGVRRMVRVRAGVLPVLDVRAVIDAVSRRVQALKPTKE